MTKTYFTTPLNDGMEDDLKILTVEFLSNQLLNHTQILNLSLDVQTVFYKTLR